MKQTKLFLSVFALMSLLACQTKKTSKEEVESFIVTNPLVTDTSFIKEYVAEIQSIQNVEIRAKVKGFI